MIENRITMFDLSAIQVDRSSRQRTNLNPDHIKSLAESISARGLIHAILVERETNRLIAGECRLEAFKLLEEEKIPGRYAYKVTEREMEALELEENIKRRDLHWTEEANAFLRFHEMHKEEDENHTVGKTAEAINVSETYAVRAILVGRALLQKHPLVQQASSIKSAYLTLTREFQRAASVETTASEKLIESTMSGVMENSSSPEEKGKVEIPSPSKTILKEDFLKWAAAYSGQKFNFLHCDFPYGIGWDTAQKFNSSPTVRGGVYEDSPETFAALCEALLSNWKRLMMNASHVVFWLPGDFSAHAAVRSLFLSRIPSLQINSFPLIWMKSDSAGTIPDPVRGGRRNYETALFMSTGDRPVVQPVNMAYAAPTARSSRIHISEKPESMLRHFFRLCVDDTTRMLDPTCGSGTSVRAAESFKGAKAMGLELDSENHTQACQALDNARRLAILSKGTDS